MTNFDMYQNQWYILYTDNYFTSMASCFLMRERGIYQLGTMQGNKLGDAKPLVIKKIARDVERDSLRVFRHTNGMRIISWMDKKPVNVLSSLPTKVCYAELSYSVQATFSLRAEG